MGSKNEYENLAVVKFFQWRNLSQIMTRDQFKKVYHMGKVKAIAITVRKQRLIFTRSQIMLQL